MSGRLNVWLLVLVAICGLSYWFGKDLVLPVGSTDEDTAAATRPAVSYDLTEEESAVHLVVLNGTEEPGLAREVSLLLGRAGCVAESVGNAPHRRYAESFLVNRRLPDSRAKKLASLLGDVPVLREMDGRGSEDAVLVLGGDWSRLTSELGADEN